MWQPKKKGAIPRRLRRCWCCLAQVLDLGDNRLENGTAPGGLLGLLGALPSNLSALQLCGNSLNETLAAVSGALPGGLRFCDLSRNALGGTIPADLALPRNLTTLLLADNLLDGSLPAATELPRTLEWLE